MNVFMRIWRWLVTLVRRPSPTLPPTYTVPLRELPVSTVRQGSKHRRQRSATGGGPGYSLRGVSWVAFQSRTLKIRGAARSVWMLTGRAKGSQAVLRARRNIADAPTAGDAAHGLAPTTQT